MFPCEDTTHATTVNRVFLRLTGCSLSGPMLMDRDRECIAAHLGVLHKRYLYHVRRVQPGPGVLCGGDGETECTSGLQDSGGQHSHSLLTGLVSIWRSRDLAAVTRA